MCYGLTGTEGYPARWGLTGAEGIRPFDSERVRAEPDWYYWSVFCWGIPFEDPYRILVGAGALPMPGNSTTREIQLVELEMLKAIAELCDKGTIERDLPQHLLDNAIQTIAEHDA